MKNLVRARLHAELTSPIRAQGMEANINTHPIRIRAPNLSQRGPRMKRMIMVPATEQMFEVQMSCLEISSDSFTSGRRGAIANQMKKAMKNVHHEQWKARMWGLEKLHSLISDALSFCAGSTLRAYSEYFFHSLSCKISKVFLLSIRLHRQFVLVEVGKYNCVRALISKETIYTPYPYTRCNIHMPISLTFPDAMSVMMNSLFVCIIRIKIL